MCEPVSMSMGLLTIAQAGANIMGQMQMQDAALSEQAYANSQYGATAEASRAAAQADINQLTIQQAQVGEQAHDEMTHRAIKAKQDAASAVVAAGEMGLGAVTSEMLERGVYSAAGMDIATIEQNRQNKSKQIEFEKESAQRRGTTVGNAPYVRVPKVDWLGTSIGAGLQIAGTYSDYKSRQTKNT